jgi:hypothetical protein
MPEHAQPLLGSDLEVENEETTVARQQIFDKQAYTAIAA